MKVIVAPSEKEIGKFIGIVQAFPKIWHGDVLDVGCRSANLKRVLANKNITYVGLDMNPPADIICNLEHGIPVEDKRYDVVVALDVLEHTDNIYKAFDELCRVSRQYVLITLPNLYEIKIRLRFLFGNKISEKYGLPTIPPLDRHRWFFSLNEARQFCILQVEKMSFEVKDEGVIIGPRRAMFIGKALVASNPNLFATHYVVLIKRKPNSNVAFKSLQ